jgi:hypothetical protein
VLKIMQSSVKRMAVGNRAYSRPTLHNNLPCISAQVGMTAGQPDMHIRRRRDHPRNPAITARNIATGVSRRISTLPPDGRTTSIAATP